MSENEKPAENPAPVHPIVMPNYEKMYCEVMDALKRSKRPHGDCKSGERYGGKPLACSACMAKLKIDEMMANYKGWRVTIG